MYHIHIHILDPDIQAEYVKNVINKELAKISVQVIKSYTNERMGEDKYFFVLRGVTNENWKNVSQLVNRALRNVDCKYVLKQPTLKQSTVRFPRS